MRKGQKHSEEAKEKNRVAHLGKAGFWSGKKLSEETKKKIGLKGAGRPAWNKGLVGYNKGHAPYNTGSLAFAGRKHSDESKEKMSLARVGRFNGENHWNWNGGVSTERDKARHTKEMKLWRKVVLERDNFSCQKCGISGGDLVAHHINNFSEFVELRSDINNGITLCSVHHQEFHKVFGRKNNTKSQIEEFIYG